jgi:hypothetical protein
MLSELETVANIAGLAALCGRKIVCACGQIHDVRKSVEVDAHTTEVVELDGVEHNVTQLVSTALFCGACFDGTVVHNLATVALQLEAEAKAKTGNAVTVNLTVIDGREFTREDISMARMLGMF